ncbi:hypothetical protein B0H65DRAFT_543825 [Neurospora tetraspora]|uniref:Uncharacterized protein n=1 Tax=Neurospora tetraspora TaxID=94610 RepID=A0AAE0JNC5_9PEZI|nr:hypothetical protein B0H65DRAFT_543825 [Neurospora tetraspora]
MGKYSSASSSKSSSSSGGKQASSSRTGSKTQKWIWYCGNCKFGPWNYQIDTHCFNCSHQICNTCDVRQIPIDTRK